MRPSNRLTALFAALTASIAAAPAIAQPPGDPRIDQRIQALTRPGQSASEARDEAILTGRDDILLMERRRFFTLFGSAGGGYTDNAGLSPTARQGDFYASADAGLRVATQLGGLVDVSAEAGVSTTRYAEQAGLDFVAAFAAVAAHVAVARFDIDIGYTPTIVWDGDLETRQLTQHRFSGGVGRAFRVGRGLIRATVGGERIEANPSAFRNSAVTAGLSGIVPINPRLTAIASIRGVRRWYDDYFEGLLGLARRDYFTEAAAGLSWQFHPRAGVDLRATYARNWSTADISRYRAASAGVALRAAFRF